MARVVVRFTFFSFMRHPRTDVGPGRSDFYDLYPASLFARDKGPLSKSNLWRPKFSLNRVSPDAVCCANRK